MNASLSIGRHVVRTQRLLWAALLLACGLSVFQAEATCFHDPDPTLRELDSLVAGDATQAVEAVRKQLAELEHAQPPGDSRRVASLYAVLAQAYSILELDGDARAAATKGLKLVPDPKDPVHLNLLTAYAENVYDAAGINGAIASIEAARGGQTRGSLADICLLITLGRLQHRQDRSDLAVVSLTQAYRASLTPALAEQRVEAASALAVVMRTMGDFAQALALNQEAVEWDTAHGASLRLSVSRFLRGEILKAMGNYSGALEEFTQTRKLSVLLDDSQGIAFADLRTCEVQIDLGQTAGARPRCTSAERAFAAHHSTDVQKEAQALLASIDLAEGHADRALATLNQVLDHDGTDMPPRRIASMYELRARANAATHNYHDAYADLDEYLRRYVAQVDAERVKQGAALRARFATDREIERNASLQRELDSTREHSKRQKQQLDWIAIASTACLVGLALLTYTLIASLRHRRQLVRLATIDSLTGLPNRRRTAELAERSLDMAIATQQPLTVGLLDMDRFKTINDRLGHASGDHVLREFARLSRQVMRSSDILGRWGGEEFLLILPDTPLELALQCVERLRSLALQIQLPSTDPDLRVSLSAGLATSVEGVKSLDDIIARADAALYEAKNQGRDLVRISKESDRMASSGIRRTPRGA